VRKDGIPGAGGTARGATGKQSSTKLNNKAITPRAARLWAACREQHDVEDARKRDIAKRIRGVAQEVGAKPGTDASGQPCWRYTCPHCGRVTILWPGHVFVGVGYTAGRCGATQEIQLLVRTALEDGAT